MKKMLMVLLCLLLVLAVAPAMAADDVTNVSGPAINYSSGLPTSNETYQAGKGTITWDAASKTLTLHDASVTCTQLSSGAGLVMMPQNSQEKVTIHLIGDNQLVATTSFSASSMIHTGKSQVVLTGGGNLTVSGSDWGVCVSEKNSNASFEFAGTGTVDITSKHSGIFVLAGNGVTFTNGTVKMNVTASSNARGIYLDGGNTVNIAGGNVIIQTRATSQANGIFSNTSASTLSITGGSLSVNAGQYAIWTKSPLNISNATVNLQSNQAPLSYATTLHNASLTVSSSAANAIPAKLIISGDTTIVAKGGTGYGAINHSGLTNSSFDGYVVLTGTTETDAQPWDGQTKFWGYKASDTVAPYVKIYVCKHSNAVHHARVEPVAGEDPAAEQNGHIEYWQCPECRKYFADSACQNELSAQAIILEPANYTEFRAVRKLAAGVDKALYTPQSVAAFESAIGGITVVWNLDASKQDDVNAMTLAYEDALNLLVLAKADYSAVNAAIQAANALNEKDYVDLSGVKRAIAAVDWNKNITQQADVDAMAKAIWDAIAALEYVIPDLPQTGDRSHIALWCALLALSAVGMGIILGRGSRKKSI